MEDTEKLNKVKEIQKEIDLKTEELKNLEKKLNDASFEYWISQFSFKEGHYYRYIENDCFSIYFKFEDIHISDKTMFFPFAVLKTILKAYTSIALVEPYSIPLESPYNFFGRPNFIEVSQEDWTNLLNEAQDIINRRKI